MKYLQKIMLVLCLVTATLGLAACSKTSESSNENQVNQTEGNSDVAGNTSDVTLETTDNATEDVAEVTAIPIEAIAKTQYPITVSDSDGNELTIESEPMKIVSMAPNITEMIYKLGLESKLIGRTNYCDYPEAVSSIETVGSLREPDIEKIISLEPDIVIASTHFSDESEKQLTDLGVKVIVLYEEHDVEGIYSIIETLGTIFNSNDRAAEAVSEMKTSVEATKAAVANLEAPSVYYVVSFGEYGDYTAGGDTFVGQLITLAGGNNIAQEVSGWSYTLESLLEADPDLIIIDEDMKDSFAIAENYKELTAVKNNQVFTIDKNTIERQGYRNAEGLRSLAEIIHPEAFK
jgi:iron complex transport system substrate-binding protein